LLGLVAAAAASSSFLLHQDYTSCLRPHGIQLAVLNLFDQRQAAAMGRIEALWRGATDLHELLSKDQSQDLPAVVARLFTRYLSKELDTIRATHPPAAAAAAANWTAGSRVAGQQPVLQLAAPAWSSTQHVPLAQVVKGLGALGSSSYGEASQQGSQAPTLMYKHSAPGAPLPFADLAAAGGQGTLPGGDLEVQQHLEEVAAALSSYRRSAEASLELQQLQGLWQQMMSKPGMQSQVARWVEVLEGDVLPHNKHTRWRAEASGPTLHLPGLVKAAATNFTSNKIFAQKTGGGARRYQVALLLDVSQSMQGHLLQCGLEALVAAAAALEQMGVTDFLVMAFGCRPVLVKGAEDDWDTAAQLALLEAVNCRPGGWAGASLQCKAQCMQSPQWQHRVNKSTSEGLKGCT
jgi:hypothetical protein